MLSTRAAGGAMLVAVFLAPAPAGLALAATADSPITCSPRQLEFTNTSSGNGPRTLLIRNRDTAPLIVAALSIRGADAREFSLVDPPCGVLMPGATCAAQVRFVPHQPGESHATLVLQLTASRTSRLEVPLSGVARGPAAVSVPTPPSPEFVAGPLHEGSPSVRVHWSAGEGPDPDGYELQESVDGAQFRSVPLPATDSTSLTARLPLSTPASGAYCFRVRAVRDGEASEWATGGAFALVPLAWERIRRGAQAAGDPPGGVELERCERARLTIPPDAGHVAAIACIVGGRGGPVVLSLDRGHAGTIDVDPTAAIAFTAGLAPGRLHTLEVRAAAGRGVRVIEARTMVAAIGLVDLDRGSDSGPLLALLTCAVALTSGTSAPAPHYEIHDDYSTPDGGSDPREAAIAPGDTPAPRALQLAFSSVSPNPCAAQSRMTFTTTRRGWVELAVVDLAGRRVRTLASGELSQGPHSVAWDGLDARGERVPPGVFFTVLHAEGESRLARVVRD